MTMQFGKPIEGNETYHLVRMTKRSFGQVLESVRREIDGAGMKVLHEIDPQAALAGFGHQIGGARLVFFFHPTLLRRLLETDWSAIVDAPLKLAVMELPDGTVCLRMSDPAAALVRYGNPRLAAYGRELAETCHRIMDASAVSETHLINANVGA